MKFIRHITKDNRRNVIDLAWKLTGEMVEDGKHVVIEVREKKRSDEQNAKLHAIFSDISKQLKFNGEYLSLEAWKLLIISGHAIATNEPNQIVTGLEGELVNIREKTSTMTIKRANSLIEYATAYAVMNGVKLQG